MKIFKDDGRTSMRVRLGTRALTSLMTFGLALASNDSSFTVKMVFSFGFAATSSSAAPVSSAPAAPAPGSVPAPAVGKAISWMFRRDYTLLRVGNMLEKKMRNCGGGVFTFRSVTRSVAWRRVRPDMSSTSLCSAGSEGVVEVEVEVEVEVGEIGGGGDDDGVEVGAFAVAVASARMRMRIHLGAETLCVAFALRCVQLLCR